MLWESDYSAELAMYEMLTFFRESKSLCDSPAVKHASRAASSSYWFGEITQHTYSRGFITERVLTDAWAGVARWLKSLEKDILSEAIETDAISVSLR